VTEPVPAAAGHTPWWWAFRALLLLASGVSLYLLWPSLIALFSSWPQLRELRPGWLAAALGFEVLSYVALWEVQRIALRTPSWFAVGTSQLAGAAMGSLVPGGGATSGAFQYRLLVRAGVAGGRVAAALTGSMLATTAAMLALPVFALPAILGGVAAPRGLVQTAEVGAGGFVVIAGLAAAALVWDAPLRLAGRAIRWAVGKVRRGRVGDVSASLLERRDEIKLAFGARWHVALVAAVGKWGFDYLALVCCLAAVGARPQPALVLLAYAAGAALTLVPFTPGGLGFVETGLTGMLALAGVGVQAATVSTLAYRLIGFWLPLPAGGIAVLLHRRRYRVADASASTATPA
jgi:uncharacterized protein (TIRG00374 family)